jgi:CO/xanthine dehydrogenase Mo-binding subunit
MKPGFTPRKAHKYIGTYLPRTADGLPKASGRAEYLDDICQSIRFPGMLVAKVLTSPYPHARIKKLDITAAEALPGVHVVLTCFDAEVQAIRPTSHAWAGVGSTVPYNRWASLRYNDQRVLGDTFHCFADKNGVAVAAESEEIAEEALRLLEIEWEVLPFYLSPAESLRAGAAPIHPEINPNGNLLPADPRDPAHMFDVDEIITITDRFYEKGDVEQGLAASDVVVEWTSSHHNADHGCLDHGLHDHLGGGSTGVLYQFIPG